jgi:adenylate kinase
MFRSIWSGIKTLGEFLFYVFMGWCLGFAVIIAVRVYDGVYPSETMRALIAIVSMIVVVVYGVRHMLDRRNRNREIQRQRERQQQIQRQYATPRQ